MKQCVHYIVHIYAVRLYFKELCVNEFHNVCVYCWTLDFEQPKVNHAQDDISESMYTYVQQYSTFCVQCCQFLENNHNLSKSAYMTRHLSGFPIITLK